MWKGPGVRWGILLGIALGGFFDGILLHQILQWHHLFSLVPGVRDLRMQVLWDGGFHALMYVVAAAALLGLWRGQLRGALVPGRALAGALLIGFGLWHVADSILSHWLLGIHRIKVDSPNRLAWDLAWFVLFGLVPLAAGWQLGRGAAPAPRTNALLLLGLTALTGAAGAWSLRPPPDQPFTSVVFRPGVAPAQMFGALTALDARLVWADPTMGVIVVDVAPDRRWRFYGHGALLVGGAGIPAGCVSWSRA